MYSSVDDCLGMEGHVLLQDSAAPAIVVCFLYLYVIMVANI